MRIGVVQETLQQERRVALTPEAVGQLRQLGYSVSIERGAGEGSFYSDADFQTAGAEVLSTAAEVAERSDILLRLHMPTEVELEGFRPGQILIGNLQVWRYPERLEQLRLRGVTVFALERMPRISRAQNMDVLSSMASIAGYKAVIVAAERFGRLLPMMVTAAGTIPPALVLVIGAGVAGLQAIATARRLGAQVEAYDIRPAVKEQVESLGARFLPLTLPVADVEQRGGYARELPEEVQRRQREALATYVARADIVITTAAVPERPAPRLITAEMVQHMRPGSLILDLAAETGGNCELTRPGEWVEVNGVSIFGPVNLPATVPVHASQMLARNFTHFLRLFVRGGSPSLHFEDDILRHTCVAHNGRLYPFAEQSIGATSEG
jgi:NAD(P) transhydrogenase subunit alpha